MIDWISFTIPCAHDDPIHNGLFVRQKRDGTVEWESMTRLSIVGSHETAVTVRSAPWVGDGFIEVSGNITKFFQGHNLFGTDDLSGLVLEFMVWLSLQRPDLVQPLETDLAAWRAGDYRLHRVDVTASFVLPSRGDVLAWLRAAEQTAYLKHRGRGQLYSNGTLYFGKGSRRWSLKIYAKGPEVEANAKYQPVLEDLPYLKAWADNVLRAELTLRGLELKGLGLETGTAWLPLDGVPFDPQEMLSAKLGAMTMTTNNSLSEEVREELSNLEKASYAAWEAGNDLRNIMSKSAFYRLRNKLLPNGIDIAVVKATEDRSNVVPLVRVLEAVPAAVPEWAMGTPLYFEPRKIREAA